MLKLSIVLLLSLFVANCSVVNAGPKPGKYGPDASPMSAKTNETYFKTQEAKDFWALMPYYTGQANGSSCSAASLTMVLNAARKNSPLTQEDELVTEKNLGEKYTDDRYRYQVSGNLTDAAKHGVRLGVSVERLAEILKTAVNRLKIGGAKSKIELEVIDFKNLDASKKKFHELLVKNEKSDSDFIILNFTQGVLTGDGGGMIGHIAPVGAYDEKQKLVLILDPDRQWYEPYWSPEYKVFDAIADKKSDSHPGYVYLQLK